MVAQKKGNGGYWESSCSPSSTEFITDCITFGIMLSSGCTLFGTEVWAQFGVQGVASGLMLYVRHATISLVGLPNALNYIVFTLEIIKKWLPVR